MQCSCANLRFKMFILFLTGFFNLLNITEAFDDRLVTVKYTHYPDELGRTIMLECCTNGIGTRSGEVPDYTWQRYFSEPPMPTTAVGVNSHTLFFPNFSSADIGRYRCKISGFKARNSAFIGVGDTGLVTAPGTISYLQSQTGLAPHLDCKESTGAPHTSFNYIFYRHHATMPSQAYIDRRSLYVPGFNADDIGIYSCIAFNSEGISYGYPYEWYFTPPADPPPIPTITQEASTDDLKTGTIMVLTCCSDAIPPPQYMWYKRNMITYDTELLTNAAGMFTSTLYVPITGIADSGVYICTVFNSAGTEFMETLVDLTPEGPPYFLSFSPSPISISQGQQKYISCVVGGDPYPTTTWSRLNGSLPINAFQDFAGLYITAVEGIDVSGVYLFTATNVNGVVEKYFEVQYVSSNTEAPTTPPTTAPSVLLDPPTNVTVVGESAVIEGTDLLLNCSAVGDPEPTYQWLRSGSALPSKVTDANTAQLVIPSMTWSDVGVYYCLAVNEGGVSYSPAIYVLLQAEQGAVISNRNDPQKGLDLGLLGKVFGSVIAVVVVLSVAATAVIYYLSRPVEHAVEKSTTVWDVVRGAHKGKNMFDIMIKVEPIPEQQLREPSLISLSSRNMHNLNIKYVIERPFECSEEYFDEEEVEECEESLGTAADGWEREWGRIADSAPDGGASRVLDGGESAEQQEGSSAVVVDAENLTDNGY